MRYEEFTMGLEVMNKKIEKHYIALGNRRILKTKINKSLSILWN